ncbi:MAG: phosphate acyltransferase PlsX [Alphaproteobacteria bacterium]|nr:MAG: phosphate acyltransferase PlsX [Alphaproteobacteria bacterium]
MHHIAVDAMGGDHAPESIVRGISSLFDESLGFSFHLYGDKDLIFPLLEKHNLPSSDPRLHVFHAPGVIASDAKPSYALRNSANTSMRLAIEAVQTNQCQAVLSGGNTGAYMGLCKVILKTLPGINRPALAGLLPTLEDRCVMLDVGANIDSTPEQLVQFSVFGRAYAACMLDRIAPTVGILNIGTEDIKGNEILRTTRSLLKGVLPKAIFRGFVEGNEVFAGAADVVVTDGFNGNVAIKSAEGAIKLMRIHLQRSLTTSWLSCICAYFLRSSIKTLTQKLDPRSYNGAPLLGLRYLAVKSHGGADYKAFANALHITMRLMTKGIISSLENSLKKDLLSHSQDTSTMA